MWYTDNLVRSLKTLKVNKDRFDADGCHVFYIRYNKKFYIIDSKLHGKSVSYILDSISKDSNIDYVFDLTDRKDTITGDIYNLSKHREIPFEIFDYYCKAVKSLKGNIIHEGIIYWKMLDIINTQYVGSDDFMYYLYNNIKEAIKFLRKRNKDYTVETYTEDLDMDFFDYARSMKIVINNKEYELCCLTTLDEVSIFEEALNNPKMFNYIKNNSNEVDTIVGDIDCFLIKNNIDTSNYDGVLRYDKALKSIGYINNPDMIVKMLKGTGV